MMTLFGGLIALCLIWLAALTVVVLLLVRQVSIIGLRLTMSGGTDTVATDGPDLRTAIPAELSAVAPWLESGTGHVLLVSATCGSCRDIADRLSGHRTIPGTVALVPGRPELADELIDLLPASLTTVRDPIAATIAEKLSIQSTPFLLTVDKGRITEKGHVYQPSDAVSILTVKEKEPQP